MKAAANIVAVVAWSSFFAALWLPVVVEPRPSVLPVLGILVASSLSGMILPGFLLGIPSRLAALEWRRRAPGKTTGNE